MDNIIIVNPMKSSFLLSIRRNCTIFGAYNKFHRNFINDNICKTLSIIMFNNSIANNLFFKIKFI
eukprot:NODE_15_length_3703_cov_263.982759_g11_i0.p3 GENE.NODE_15_length_3703_cov_263.982759_g11_i0~~NODE_15_length_3703_cov_263.982759_g11_i0.p3  ORF type:complete len:65 (+),score=2.22 NODE_15_length_3703_cov_263.982759_g11_i0:1571-1765(+)